MNRVCEGWFRPGAKVLGLVVLAAGIMAPWLRAQDAEAGARAARLSSVEGQVQVAQGNQILASQALANTPLFEGTKVSTADDGQAEVQFEDGSVARISPGSSLTLSVLRQQGGTADTEFLLGSGLGYFELQGENQGARMRVKFGDSVVTASGFTVLRIDLDNPPGELAVFSGNAHLERGNALVLDLHGGESVTLRGGDPTSYSLAESIEPNSWDAWNSDRDQALTAQEATRTAATSSFANNNNPALSDLDANGNWYNVPGQGYVWSPYEASNAGWDPYGFGSWMWTPTFGYMWVSGESWGYMPFESGMWNYYDGFGWGWMPGGGLPWWGGGGGWGYNIGSMPFRYRPPNRPRGGPVRPGSGVQVSGGKYQPYPVLAVNRLRDASPGEPVRGVNAPRVIAGNVVQPLRPLSPRPIYNRMVSGGVSRSAPANPGTVNSLRPQYSANPGAGVGASRGYWIPSRSSPGAARPSAPSGSSGSRSAAPSGSGGAPSHSTGGGGGGASHSGGGGSYGGGGGSYGGGGGGGGSHGGGGGGGGGSHH